MTRVIEIVKAHLVAGGFDGLVQPAAECGCELGDLAPARVVMPSRQSRKAASDGPAKHHI